MVVPMRDIPLVPYTTLVTLFVGTGIAVVLDMLTIRIRLEPVPTACDQLKTGAVVVAAYVALLLLALSNTTV